MFARIRTWHILLLLAVVTTAVFGPFLRNEFVTLDDGLLITRNPAVQELSVRSLRHIFTTYDPELYVPLTLFTYQIDHILYGLNPFGFHLTNLLLHIGSVLLLFLIATRLTMSRAVGLVTSFLFAIHPLQTEAVLWASARKDLLAGFFFFVTLWVYLQYRETGSRRMFWLCIGAFALGLLAKVSIVVLPLVLLLVDWLQDRSIKKEAWVEKWPFFGLSMLFGIIAAFGKTEVLSSSGPMQTVLLALKSTVFYLQKLFIPDFFSAIYPQLTPVTLWSAEFWIPSVIVIAMVICAGLIVRRSKIVGFGLLFYFLLLIPNATNFFKNGFLFFASDRYAYLASIGIFLLVGVLTDAFLQRSRVIGQITAVIGVLVLGALGYKTRLQAETWRDSEALYRNVVAYYPGSAMAHNNLGDALLRKKNAIEAEAEFTTALSLDPELTASHINMGNLQREQGKLNEAASSYRKGIASLQEKPRLNVDEVPVYYYLAMVLESQGKMDEAIAAYTEAAKRAPQLAEPQYNLGLQYEKSGKMVQAISAYQSAAVVDPRYIAAQYRLAQLYAEQGRLPEAAAALEAVVAIDPGYEKAAKHLVNIRRILEGN